MVVDSLRTRISELAPILQQGLDLLGQAQTQHGQQLDVDGALHYTEQIQVNFKEHQEVYQVLLDIMGAFRGDAFFLVLDYREKVRAVL